MIINSDILYLSTYIKSNVLILFSFQNLDRRKRFVNFKMEMFLAEKICSSKSLDQTQRYPQNLKEDEKSFGHQHNQGRARHVPRLPDLIVVVSHCVLVAF